VLPGGEIEALHLCVLPHSGVYGRRYTAAGQRSAATETDQSRREAFEGAAATSRAATAAERLRHEARPAAGSLLGGLPSAEQVGLVLAGVPHRFGWELY
jgi:hypothetical protein